MKRLAVAPAVFWTLAFAVALVTLCPIELRPKTGHVVLERAGAFFILGASSLLAFPRRQGQALVGVQVLALVLELAQAAVPGRHGQVVDALEKMAGGLLGAVVAAIVLAAVARSHAESVGLGAEASPSFR